ncbi:MAG: metal ABC transporter permease, partial [Gammaproteobacteria bacterium]|nr:metal ABC transporter permease [Gammaproteobacteria bacterium]
DLALAQIAGLGLIAAYSFDWEPGGWQVQAVALGSALLGALLLHFTERRWPEIQEALIGTLFVLASSGGILLLAGNPHGGEHLRELLVGQILWVGYQQLLPVALVYAVVLAAGYALRSHTSSLPFYLLFALSITASVQLVGVYLVFATLIIPALAIRRYHGGALLWGYAIGIAGYAVGLLLAALLDLPAGAMVVYSLAGTALLFHTLRRAPLSG